MSRFRVCAACGGRLVAGEPCPRCAGRRRVSSCLECGAQTDGGHYCPAHAALGGEAARLAAQPYRSHYLGAEYRRNRQLRYEFANGRCEACGNDIGDRWECDHVVPLRDGGTNMVENLRAYCLDCHKKKTRADRRARRLRGGQ